MAKTGNLVCVEADFVMITAQAIGLIGMAIDLYSTTFKNDRLLKLAISLNSITFAIHFGLIGAYAAVLSELLTGVRSAASLYTKHWLAMSGFIFAYIIGAAITYENWTDLFPYIASIFGTLAMFLCDGIRMRLLFIGGQFFWLIYSLIHGSIGGSLLYTLLIIGTSVTIFRLFRAKNSLT